MEGATPDVITDVATALHITVADAKSALADSDDILRFKTAFATDPRFGDVWAEYTDGYTVHVRAIDPTFEPEIRAFEHALGRPVARHSGGASAPAMASLIAEMQQVTPQIGFAANGKTGFLEVWRTHRDRLPPTVAGSQFVTFVDEPASNQTDVIGQP